jgi:starch synthase
LFDRRGTPYCTPEGGNWQDNHLRFARLSLAAADIAAGRCGLDWTLDIVHINDWPSGLTPAYMRWDGTQVPNVLTIHNVAYQGNFDASTATCWASRTRRSTSTASSSTAAYRS